MRSQVSLSLIHVDIFFFIFVILIDWSDLCCHGKLYTTNLCTSFCCLKSLHVSPNSLYFSETASSLGFVKMVASANYRMRKHGQSAHGQEVKLPTDSAVTKKWTRFVVRGITET